MRSDDDDDATKAKATKARTRRLLATDEGEELVDICSDVLAELGQLAGLNVEEKVTSERVR